MTKNKKKSQAKLKQIHEKKEKQISKSNDKYLKELKRDGIEDIAKTIEKLEIGVSKNLDSEIQCTILPFERPSPRVSSSFNVHPLTGELIIFGGEYYNGREVKCFHDLIKWNIEKNEWKRVVINEKRDFLNTYVGGPKPRCSHQSVIFNDSLFIHGGEYSTEHQFYHFRDLWRLNLKNYTWSEIKTSGLSPSPRSGHRMIVWRHFFVVFGGFHDTLRETKYYNDIHILNTKNWHWSRIDSAKFENCPSPRSGVQMILCPNLDRIFIYGGYSKIKDNSKNSVGKIHDDCWFLDMKPFLLDGKSPIWEKITRKGNFPTPRSGSSIVSFKNQGVIFGGVFDQEDDLGLNLNSSFYNDMYTFDLINRRWYKIEMSFKELKLERKDDHVNISEDQNNFKDQVEFNNKLKSAIEKDFEFECCKTEVLSDKYECDKKGSLFRCDYLTENHLDNLEFNSKKSLLSCSTDKLTNRISNNNVSDAPLPRINCGMFVKGNYIFIYGGLFECGRKTITLDDCWCFNILKKDGWKCILPLTEKSEEWEGSDSEQDSDTESSIYTETTDSSSSLYSDDELNFDQSIEEREFRHSRQEIELIIKKYQLDDLDKVPFLHESLKCFFMRTKKHWIDLSKDADLEKKFSEKEISRNAFNLAFERFNMIKPYIKLIREAEMKQIESEK